MEHGDQIRSDQIRSDQIRSVVRGARVDAVHVDGRESREGGGVAFDSLLDVAPLY